MKNMTKSLTVAATAFVALSTGMSANAGSTEALKACKAAIAEDARLAGYKVNTRMDTFNVRGRYNYIKIDVRAEAEDGRTAEWSADCKARGSGRVEGLEMAQISANGEMLVAEN